MASDNPLKRFFKYTIIGGISTAIDLALLWFLTDILSIYYLVSAALAFVIAGSFSYSINRTLNFKGTNRKLLSGYLYSITFSLVGLISTLAILAFLVEVLSVHYLLARFLAACFVGLWLYFVNTKFTFGFPIFKKHHHNGK